MVQMTAVTPTGNVAGALLLTTTLVQLSLVVGEPSETLLATPNRIIDLRTPGRVAIRLDPDRAQAAATAVSHNALAGPHAFGALPADAPEAPALKGSLQPATGAAGPGSG